MLCQLCSAVRINGILCHEHGCPESWKTIKDCKQCGNEFKPEFRNQEYCENCMNA